MTWWMKAKSGDEVLLIRKPTLRSVLGGPFWRRVSALYRARTKRSFVIEGFEPPFAWLPPEGSGREAPGMRLVGQEGVFNPWWFRPVKHERPRRSTDTGMRILRKLAAPPPQPKPKPKKSPEKERA